MKGRDFCEELMTPLDIRQVFVTDLSLLGFDTAALNARIPFNKNMFDVPNKSAFETVMHFLFKKLNPIQCHEYFRECWPIVDRKQEHLFRKACIKWLGEISVNDQEAHLPRVVASLFLSPGGNRFCQFLFSFTRYVLLKVTRTEFGRKDRVHHPALTPDSIHLGDLVATTIQTNAVRYRKKFFDRLQEFALIQKEWQHYADELVKDHRHLCKLARDKEKELNSLLQASADRGSPISRNRRSIGVTNYDLDIQTVRRTQKIQKVRALWKNLCDYFRDSQQELEIIQSILQGVADKYKIDASTINVKVPELLLREFDRELQSRAVSNTYEGGNLNLLSVVQLWNLSLHLYIENLHKVGVPDLKEVVPRIHSHVHTHHANLANLRALETKLKKDVIPSLKDSVSDLRTKLDNETRKPRTPPGTKTSSLRLGLMPPTPPVNFDGSPVDMEAVPSRPLMKTPKSSGSSTLRQKKISMRKCPRDESTPAAATRIISVIREEKQSALVQGSPVFAARAALTGKKFHGSKVPVPVTESSDHKPPEGRVRQHSAPSKVTTTIKTPNKETRAALGHLTAQVKRSKSSVTREKFYSIDSTSSVMTTPTTPDRKDFNVFSSIKRPPRTPGSTSRERAENILVDKIVDSMVSYSPLYQAPTLSNENTPQDIDDVNLKDPLAALEESAFEVRDKIARSPFSQQSDIPKINLDASMESPHSPPQAIHNPAEPDTSEVSFKEAARSEPVGGEDFDVSKSTNNNCNNYIGTAQEQLEDIFHESLQVDEEEKRLEELLSFSMKIDDTHLVDTDEVSPTCTKEEIGATSKKVSLKQFSESNQKRVHFHESDDHLDQDLVENQQQQPSIRSTQNHHEEESEFSSKEYTTYGLKKFSLDDDVLKSFDDIVVGGDVLNGVEQIDQLKQNESLLSGLNEPDYHRDTNARMNTAEIDVPLIEIACDDFSSMSYRKSSKFASIHSNMLNESVEDLNDISLRDVAMSEDSGPDIGAFSPPEAVSPTELTLHPAEESQLSRTTGISNDLLMRFRRLKMSNADPIQTSVRDDTSLLTGLREKNKDLPEENQEDDKGLDVLYLMESPRPKGDEEKRFTLDLAFESDSDEAEKGQEDLIWTSDHKTRFKTRLDEMLGDDDSILLPPSP